MILYQRAPLPIIHPVLISESQWTSRVEQTLNEHREMVKALLRGKVPEAMDVLRTHLNERAFIPALCRFDRFAATILYINVFPRVDIGRG